MCYSLGAQAGEREGMGPADLQRGDRRCELDPGLKAPRFQILNVKKDTKVLSTFENLKPAGCLTEHIAPLRRGGDAPRARRDGDGAGVHTRHGGGVAVLCKLTD